MKHLYLFSILFFSHASFAGISNFLAWPKAAINVCFGDKETFLKHKDFKGRFSTFPESQKDRIKHYLNDEFTPERTGYHFVGFKDCKDETEHDVILVRKPVLSPLSLTLRGKATIGRHSQSPSDQYGSAPGAVMLTSTGINKGTVIHEFGHILGLIHEHLHPDSKEEAQSYCRYYDMRHQERAKYMIYSPFDEISVMNYCHIQSDLKTGLSAGDVSHIRTLYFLSAIKDKRKF